MAWKLTGSLDDYVAAAGVFLRSRPVHNRIQLESWLAAFRRELAGFAQPGPGMVEDRIGYGGLTLREVGGTAVSLAGFSRPAGGVDPPRAGLHPARPTGGTATAGRSPPRSAGRRSVREQPTWSSSPTWQIRTSNALYRRLGYRPVENRVVLRFES